MNRQLRVFTVYFLLTIFGVFLQTVNAAPGDLDTSFSFDGITGIRIGSGADDSGTAAAIQADGKFVIVGDAQMGFRRQCAVSRYNANGSLDTSFGDGGKVLYKTAYTQEYESGCRAVAVQPDGKIVIVGTATPFTGNLGGFLMRLNPNGSLDTTFDTDGKQEFFSFYFYAVAIQTDGRIIVGGNAFSGANNNFPITRYNTDGSIDTTFTNNGTLSAFINALAIQPDGKIVGAGSAFGTSNSDFLLTRLESNGTFDTSFDGDGKVLTNILSQDIVQAVALQPDGKIVVAGYSGLTEDFSVARYNANGSLDTTFDGDGYVMTQVLNGRDFANAVVIQPDGKIVAAGQSGTGSVVYLSLVRYNVNGSLDTSFDGDGKLTTEIADFGNVANSAILQPDGKIFVSGFVRYGESVSNYNSDTAMVRYNADGSLDTTFDGDGKSVFDLAIPEAGAYNTAIQPDGKILAVGYGLINRRNYFAVARFNPDGSVDASFDNDGSTLTDIGTGTNTAEAVAVQPDGKIVVAGWSNENGGGTTNYDFSVVRYNADGSLDSSFDGDGKVKTNILNANNDFVSDVAIQSDGKIIVLGQTVYPSGSEVGALVRYNANGSLDTTFDGDGILTVSGVTHAVKLQPDGKIVCAGNSLGGVKNGLAVLRLHPNGSFDTSFDGDGIASLPVFNINDIAYELVVQPDGKIAASGRAFSPNGEAFGVVRFNPNGSPDTSFDGDGKNGTVTGANGYTSDLVLQSDGKLVVGGGRLIRYNANGSLDTAYGVNGISTNAGVGMSIDSNDRVISVAGTFEGPFGVKRILGAAVLGRAPFDFDGDGKTDVSIFRSAPGEWWINRSSNGAIVAGQFGVSTDKIVPADYSGDGKTDLAVWRPSSGEWFILRSEDNSYYSVPFGTNGDLPAPADFDADGKADLVIFRPSSGTWYINKSTGGTEIINFGRTGDVPVVGDYDRDGRADIAIWRVSTREWWILKSSTLTTMTYQFGNSTDIPVPGDYTGDGRTDSALWRPSTGEWYILRSENITSFYAVPFGNTGDIPAPGDYDGDGRFDTAVFRPSAANWYVNRSTSGLLITTFGISSDKPVPSAFTP